MQWTRRAMRRGKGDAERAASEKCTTVAAQKKVTRRSFAKEELACIEIFGGDFLKFGHAVLRNLVVGQIVRVEQSLDLTGPPLQLPPGPDLGIAVSLTRNPLE